MPEDRSGREGADEPVRDRKKQQSANPATPDSEAKAPPPVRKADEEPAAPRFSDMLKVAKAEPVIPMAVPEAEPAPGGIEIARLKDHAAPKKAVNIVSMDALSCPLGLERTPQGLEVILRNLDVPRSKETIHRYLGVMATHINGTPIAANVKILPMIRDPFGDKFGCQQPFSFYYERNKGLNEDGRTKLSCVGACHSCGLVESEALRTDINNIKKTVIA